MSGLGLHQNTKFDGVISLGISVDYDPKDPLGTSSLFKSLSLEEQKVLLGTASESDLIAVQASNPALLEAAAESAKQIEADKKAESAKGIRVTSDQQLHGVSLAGARLSGDFRGKSFAGSNLSNVTFEKGSVIGSDTDLEKVSLRGADLTNLEFEGTVNLKGVTTANAKISIRQLATSHIDFGRNIMITVPDSEGKKKHVRLNKGYDGRKLELFVEAVRNGKVENTRDFQVVKDRSQLQISDTQMTGFKIRQKDSEVQVQTSVSVTQKLTLAGKPTPRRGGGFGNKKPVLN